MLRKISSTLTNPLLIFFVIACAIPFAILASMAALPDFYNWWYGREFSYEAASLEAAQRLGYDFVSTNLIERIPGVVLEPVLSIAIIYAAAPTIAAILVTLFLKSPETFKDFWGRYNPVRRGISLKEAAGLYLLLVTVSLAMRIPLVLVGGTDVFDWPSVFSWTTLYVFIGYSLFDQGGLLEEGGWRAYALPILLRKFSTPLSASIALGFVWSFWHVPRDLMIWDKSALAFFIEYGVFTFGTVTMSIVITYFFNTLNGSIWPAIIVHGLVNQTFDIASKIAEKTEQPIILGQSATTFTVYATIGVVAALMVWRCGPELGAKDRS